MTELSEVLDDERRWCVVHGDARDVLWVMPDACVDAIVTDPPYELAFMARKWDASGIAYNKRLWREALRVLKPGGHLLAFGGTRTYHRMACAIEDAGFEIRDSIHWMYGSGFPKSTNVSKQIDKKLGTTHLREVVHTYTAGGNAGTSTKAKGGTYAVGADNSDSIELQITTGGSPDARRWDGWGSAMKPAHEPIVCAKKRLTQVPCDAILRECADAVEGLLWWLSPVRFVELSFVSSVAGLTRPDSVPWLADALRGLFKDESGEMDTFSSQEMASTFLSIGLSWNSILGAVSEQMSTFTTRTVTELTTIFQTLRCCILRSMRDYPVAAELLQNGVRPSVVSAEPLSPDEWLSLKRTVGTAPDDVFLSIAPKILDTFARIAAALSLRLPVIEGVFVHRPAQIGTAMDCVVSSLPSASNAERALDDRTVRSTAVGNAWRGPIQNEICLARKTLEGTLADNVLEHGTGALNIDACRIPTDWFERSDSWKRSGHSAKPGEDKIAAPPGAGIQCHPGGRWPANVVFSHDPECGVRCVDGCAVKELDEQSGVSLSNGGTGPASRVTGMFGITMPATGGLGDFGGASRFFYCAKPARAERESGLSGFRKRSPGEATRRKEGSAGISARAGAGRSGGTRNPHATVKPDDMMRYLCRLITPPGGVVLDMFCGSGSTGRAALLEGFRFIGIELNDTDDEPFVQVARARIAHVAGWTPPHLEAGQEPPRQRSLFGDEP